MIHKDDKFLEGKDDKDLLEFLLEKTGEFASEEEVKATVYTNDQNKSSAEEASVKKKALALSYNINKIVSRSLTSVIYQATVRESGETVAIKKIQVLNNYKNRELEIMREIDHPNILSIRQYFYTKEHLGSETLYFLNMVLDYIPETMQKLIFYYTRVENGFPHILMKIFGYQLFRGLARLHSLDICHRNLKPTNILINPINYTLKICDFGSAKKLLKGQRNLNKICSRCYRAPEIMIGSEDYSTKIDVWSAGCILVEMLTGKPVFQAESDEEQLTEIYNVIGEPVSSIKKSGCLGAALLGDRRIKGKGWSQAYNTPEFFIDLISRVLVLSPEERPDPLKVLCHAYFDEIRGFDLEKKLVGINLEGLFVFSAGERGHESFEKKLLGYQEFEGQEAP